MAGEEFGGLVCDGFLRGHYSIKWYYKVRVASEYDVIARRLALPSLGRVVYIGGLALHLVMEFDV